MNSYTQIDTVEVGEAAPEGAGAGTVGAHTGLAHSVMCCFLISVVVNLPNCSLNSHLYHICFSYMVYFTIICFKLLQLFILKTASKEILGRRGNLMHNSNSSK